MSRNSLFALLTRISTAVATAIITLYLVRALGPEGFGVFALAVSTGGLLRRPSEVGITQSAARFVAERHDDLRGVAGVLGVALRLRTTTASLIGVALFVLAGPIAELYSTPELLWPLRAIAISFIGQSILAFALAMFTALRRTRTGFWLVTVESTLELTATVALVVLFGGATAATAGRAIAYVAGAILAIWLLGRMLGRPAMVRTGPSPVSRREFMTYSGAMFIVAGAFTAFSVIDVLLLGALLDPTAVAIFSAPLQLITFLGFVGLAVSQGVAPHHVRRADRSPPVAALERAIRLVLIVQALFVPFAVLWAGPIVELALGPDFEASADVLRGMSLYLFLTGVGPLLFAPLNYMGEARRRIPIAISALLINAVIDLILIPRIGVMGAVIGCTVGYTLFIGAHLWLCRVVIGISVARIARTAVAVLVAAALSGAVLLAVGTSDLGIVQWIGGAVGAGLVYLGAVLASRDLSREELGMLTQLPKRALGRR
ncbi:polysaccharide biosynthesis protein [Thermoleophilia bacterium SCSIO 60948]|nr:polysaccharide biosynthesis protein [Thermoleophilia bacterium SCSIO 60948]